MEIIAWLVLLWGGMVMLVYMLGRADSGRAGRRVIKAFASRTWGDYHRFLSGKQLESGECEVYRTRVQGVSVYAVERHTNVEKRATCILTDRRLMMRDERGGFVQIRLDGVRATHAHREYDSLTGFAYRVAIERTGSCVHDPLGDICLLCENQAQSQELVSAIESALSHKGAPPLVAS